MSTHPSALFEKHRPKSPGLPFAVAAVVALLILSLWLHFLLALEIESLGRDIDVKTEELERLRRENLDTIGRITVLESQRRMADEAKGMGFLPQQPLYLAVSRPLARPASSVPDSVFLSIWSVGAGRDAVAAWPAEQGPEELAEPATSIAHLP